MAINTIAGYGLWFPQGIETFLHDLAGHASTITIRSSGGFRTDFRTPDIHKPRPIGLRGISRGFNLEHQYHHQHHGDRKGRSRNRDYAYERIFTQHLNRLFDVLLIHNSNRYFNFSLFFSLKLVISETTTSSPGSKPPTTSTYSKLLSPSCTFRLINWSPLTTNNSYSPFPT